MLYQPTGLSGSFFYKKTYLCVALTTSIFITSATSGSASWQSYESQLRPLSELHSRHYSYTISLSVDSGTDISFFKSYSNLYNDETKTSDNPINLILAARADYKNLLSALYAKGYYGGSIQILINGHEASSYPLNSDIPLKNTISIYIRTGKPFYFSTLRSSPQLPDRASSHSLDETFSEINYLPNQIALSKTIEKAELSLLNEWLKLGHSTTQIRATNVIADHRNHTLRSTIFINPGPLTYYGPIRIKNRTQSSQIYPDFIRWMVGLQYGKKYHPNDLEKAQKRLELLQVFNATNIVIGDPIGKNALIPISVILEEKPLRQISLGGNYTTVDGGGMEAYWQHRNLFGRAENLKLLFKIGRIAYPKDLTHPLKSLFSINALSYTANLTFRRPGIYDPDTNFLASVDANRSVLNTYLQNSATLKLGVSHAFSGKMYGSLYLTGTRAKTWDNYYKTRNFLWSGLLSELVIDTRDNQTNPSKGVYLAGSFIPFYSFNKNRFMQKITFDSRVYLAFNSKKNIILAGRLEGGQILNSSVSDIPSDMVFFTGGSNSIRGYAYRNIGVVMPDGNTIGGSSLIVGSTELRMLLGEAFGLVLFADAGVVGLNLKLDRKNPLYLGTGLGIRYITSLGPIRVDFAIPVNRTKRDPKFSFYVGIGQAF